jgi:hypothetical protein
MLIAGSWFQCDDGIVRPIIPAEVLSKNGTWRKANFLLDIGADRTVFTAGLLSVLRLEMIEKQGHLSGLGGVTNAVLVNSQIRLRRENADFAVFRGQFAGAADPDALDMSILGRDIVDLFAAIVDRPGNFVCLLGQNHRYKIEYLGS